MNWRKTSEELPEPITSVLVAKRVGDEWQYQVSSLRRWRDGQAWATSQEMDHIDFFEFWTYIKEPTL